MGLNYRFEIIAARDLVGRLVEALAVHLALDDGNRLLAAARRDPEHLVDLARKSDDGSFGLCLTFLFERDERLDEYEVHHGCSDPIENRVAVGCVWTYFYCGNRFTHMQFTAATSTMSRVFEHSPNVEDVFVKIATDSGASIVTFHDEECDLVGVWPWRGRPGCCLLEEFEDEDVDAYCEAVLKLAGAQIQERIQDRSQA